MNLPSLPVIPTLPTVAGEYLLLATALAALVAIAAAGRALLAWQAIARQRHSLDQLTESLEERASGHDRLVAARAGLVQLNRSLESGLWELPAFDRRLVQTTERLTVIRRLVDDWRGESGEGVRQAVGAAAGVLDLLSAGRRLRRVIQR